MSEEITLTFPPESVLLIIEQEKEKSQENLEQWKVNLKKATSYEATDEALRAIAQYEGEIRAYDVASFLLRPFSLDLD